MRYLPSTGRSENEDTKRISKLKGKSLRNTKSEKRRKMYANMLRDGTSDNVSK